MFDLSLASFGIGSARVDTRLTQHHIQAGEFLKGNVFVQGGSSHQTIDSIYLYIVTQYLKENKIKNYLFKKYVLSQTFTIEPDEKKEIPFNLPIPIDLPMSCGKFPIYLKTGLDIKMAVDPTDQDRFEVLPIPIVCELLKYIEESGFVLHSVVNQFEAKKRPHPFFQCFQFRPSGPFHGYIDHLHVIFDVSPQDIKVDLEIIRDQSVLNSSFYWNFAQPIESFHLNGRQILTDPVKAFKEYLNKGQ